MVSPFSGHVAVGLTYSNHQETIDINRYLFIDVPKPRIVRKLTAFFYGNDIPVSIASQLYNACNDKYNLQVTEYICNLYSHWQRCRYKIHMSEYYNVRLHKFIWINGNALTLCRSYLKRYCTGRKTSFFHRAFKFTYYTEIGLPSRKKIITIKLKRQNDNSFFILFVINLCM